MIVIGLTGGIASGKSTVSNYLTKLGAKIIDADLIAREIVVPGLPAWQEIKTTFGGQVIMPDKTLDRKVLGEIIFSDPVKKELLDAIMLPKIMTKTAQLLEDYRNLGLPAVVIDAPLLLECNMAGIIDEVWVVYVPESMQTSRLMARDRITAEQAGNRIASQMPIEQKKALADKVIDNSGDIAVTFQQVEELWQKAMHNLVKKS